MKKIFSFFMAFILSVSMGLFFACGDKPCKHAFGEWETVTEASCIAGQKQRICESCNFTETAEIPALDDFFAHTFDENTLCSTCGHQEFIESEEYIEYNADKRLIKPEGVEGIDVIIWWNSDKSYGLRLLIQYGKSGLIYDYVGTPINVISPSKYNGQTITGISSYPMGGGFQNCKTLKSIILQEGIYTIGSFLGCTALEKVRLPNTLEIFDSFRDCISLTEITIPSGITSDITLDIEGCTALKKVYISSNYPYYEALINWYPNIEFIFTD